MDIIAARLMANRLDCEFADVPHPLRNSRASSPTASVRQCIPLSALFLFLVLLVAPGAAPVAAQGFSGLDDVDAAGTSYHRFIRPGEATVEVLILGNVAPSGIYVVGIDTGLPELLALSGATLGASTGRDEARMTVRIHRQHGAGRDVVYEAPVQEVLNDPANIPAFRDGDIIYIEAITRRRLDWFQMIRTVSSIVSLVYIAQRLISGSR